MRFPVNTVGQIGIIYDRPPHELPPNAWTHGVNVRFRDAYVEKTPGDTGVFGTPGNGAYWLLPIVVGPSLFWLQAGATSVYAWDGTSHTDITRTSGAYTAALNVLWTGGNLGGIPVLTNGRDIPQYWSPVSAAQALQDFPTGVNQWNAGWVCQAIRPWKQVLVAMNITKSSTVFPQMVKVSHPASAGSLASLWNEAEPTLDAVEFELSDTDGAVVDGLPMGDAFMMYKTDQVWGMQFIPGGRVVRYYKVLDGYGALSSRCIADFQNGRHAVLGFGDFYVHDGTQVASPLESRLRDWLFRHIDSTNYQRSFVWHNFNRKEIWICFPSTGASLPNTAVIWRYLDNTTAVRELDDFSFIAAGIVDDAAQPGTWNSDTAVWNTDTSVWDEETFSLVKRGGLAAMPGSPGLRAVDNGATFAGASYSAFVERVGIGIPLTREGPPDLVTVKQVSGIYPRIEGTLGGVVKVEIGTQFDKNQAINWEPAADFVIGTTEFIPVIATGRLHSLRFSSTTSIDWRMEGYDLDIRPRGRF